MGTLAPSPEARQDRRPNGLYERDFYSWSMQQADALKRRDFKAVDWDNVIEEIEDLGLAQKHDWEAYCARDIERLLKIHYWDHSTEWVLRHWSQEIENFRDEMAELMDKNPGLKGQYAEMFAGAWKRGRRYALKSLAMYDEKRLVARKEPFSRKELRRKWDGILPRKCPYRFEHVTAFDAKTDQEPREDVWPPEVAGTLNARLNQDYPILPDYKPERGAAGGFTW